MPRFDLHVHTVHSHDGHCTLDQVVEVARSLGLDGVAITDHDSVGAFEEIERFRRGDFILIPGIEVSSKDGHIVGLGVRRLIPKGLSAGETVRAIRDQGGIAVAAHPFKWGIKSGLVRKAKFDAIETLNSRTPFFGNPLASRFAKRYGFPVTAGSDAHFANEIGLASVGLNCGLETRSVLEEILRGGASVAGRTLPLSNYLRKILHKAFHRV